MIETLNLQEIEDQITVLRKQLNELQNLLDSVKPRVVGVPTPQIGTITQVDYQTQVKNKTPVIFAGDLTGDLNSQTVVGIQRIPVDVTGIQPDSFLQFNGSTWGPSTVIPAGLITFGKDLSGSATAQNVIGIQGHPVSSTVPTVNQIFVYNGSVWVPTSDLTLNNLTVAGNANFSNPINSTSDLGTSGKIIFYTDAVHTGYGQFRVDSTTTPGYHVPVYETGGNAQNALDVRATLRADNNLFILSDPTTLDPGGVTPYYVQFQANSDGAHNALITTGASQNRILNISGFDVKILGGKVFDLVDPTGAYVGIAPPNNTFGVDPYIYSSTGTIKFEYNNIQVMGNINSVALSTSGGITSGGDVNINAAHNLNLNNGGRIALYSPDQSKNLQLYAQNELNPHATIWSSDGYVDTNANFNFNNGARIACFSTDNSQNVSMFPQGQLSSNPVIFCSNQLIEFQTAIYTDQYVSATAFVTHGSGTSLEEIKTSMINTHKRKYSEILNNKEVETEIPLNAWNLVPQEDGIHILAKKSETELWEAIVPWTSINPITKGITEEGEN